MSTLSKQQTSFCENMGILGVLITVACLVQQMIFMLSHWITFAIAGVYLLAMLGFILLAYKKIAAVPVLISSTVLVFLLEALMMLSMAFSLVLIILLIYLIILLVMIYVDGIARQLKLKAIAEKEEREKWERLL